MLARKLAIVLLAFGVSGIGRVALAQRDAGQERDKTLIDRLDDLGKTIFGGVLPSEGTKSRAKAVPMPKNDSFSSSRRPKATNPPDDDTSPQSPDRRAGSVLTGSKPRAGSVSDRQTAGDDVAIAPQSAPVPTARAADGQPKPIRRSLINALFDDSSAPEKPAPRVSADSLKETTGEPLDSIGRSIDRPSAGKSTARPLHERLSAARQSVFEPANTGEPQPRPESTPPSAPQPKQIAETPAAESTDLEPTTVRPSVQRRVAQRARPEIDAGRVPAVESTPDAAAASPEPVERKPVVVENSPPPTENDRGVLTARKGPAITMETLGPRRTTVGKESRYDVNIANSGEVAAEELVVSISLPEWAEVAGAEPSSGAIQGNVPGQRAGTLWWKVGRLDAKAVARITLRVIPRESRPFDLAVRWDYQPVISQAMIEVQEPKFALQLEGPREVLYGKKELYRLKLTNVGNGAAEDVAIMLMPIGSGENVPATHRVGTLTAGEEKVLDVELTARQAGNLTIQVEARGEGGVRAELAEKVLVRRAGLKVDVDGPRVQYVGAAAAYAVRVRNTGTAAARNVNLSVALPAGAKYLGGIEGARADASGRLEWTIENINPDVQQAFGLKCSLGAAGVSRIEVSATADDDLTASAATTTRVESVANLTMDVRDPEGPVPVGEEATYEVHVRNRGTKEAVGVEVFAYFSRGVEPTGAEGAPNRLSPGQVTFQPIPILAAGAEAVFKVRARAETAGSHVFRAEAHCKPLAARLIREATNLYYLDAPPNGQQMAAEPGAEGPVPEGMRTVTRPASGQPTFLTPRK